MNNHVYAPKIDFICYLLRYWCYWSASYAILFSSLLLHYLFIYLLLGFLFFVHPKLSFLVYPFICSFIYLYLSSFHCFFVYLFLCIFASLCSHLFIFDFLVCLSIVSLLLYLFAYMIPRYSFLCFFYFFVFMNLFLWSGSQKNNTESSYFWGSVFFCDALPISVKRLFGRLFIKGCLHKAGTGKKHILNVAAAPKV